jgi:hypothetical protein
VFAAYMMLGAVIVLAAMALRSGGFGVSASAAKAAAGATPAAIAGAAAAQRTGASGVRAPSR